MPLNANSKVSRALAKEWLEIRGVNVTKYVREQYVKLSLKHFPSEDADPTKFQQVSDLCTFFDGSV
jgi:hypothetical protein